MMNSFAKFQAKVGTDKQLTAVEAKVSVPNNTQKPEKPDRILTVDIKTMRAHMRDEKNFNNPHTILELFAKIHHISPTPEDLKMRQYHLTLKSLQSKQPCFKMQADYFGNAVRSMQSDDNVRCVGRLIGQTGRFRVMYISKIDLNNEWTLIERLEAISSFELTQLT